MKLLFFYIIGLTLAWLSLNAILVAVAYWSRDGALVPLISGLLGLALAARLILAAVRCFTRPPNGRHEDIII